MDDRTQNILKKMDIIHDKECEMINEAKRLLQQPRTPDSMICINSLYAEYKKLQTQKEFCEYCLMFDYIEPEL